MKPVENMEATINALLAQDIAAQEELYTHQLQRQKIADEMAAAKESITIENHKHAQTRIQRIREEHQAEFESQIDEMNRVRDEAVAALQETYDSNLEEWINTLFHRCID